MPFSADRGLQKLIGEFLISSKQQHIYRTGTGEGVDPQKIEHEYQSGDGVDPQHIDLTLVLIW